MCGSRPLPVVVTRSIGTCAEGFSAFSLSISPLTRSMSALLVGPRLEPPQNGLEAHERVENEEPADVEEQHGDRIGEPILLAPLIDTASAVEHPFDGLQGRREECRLAIEDARHVAAKRPRQRDDDRAVEQNFEPAYESPELLGTQQGINEVDQQRRGHDATQDVFDEHGGLSLETVTAVGVGDRNDEEADAAGEQDYVQHALLLLRYRR